LALLVCLPLAALVWLGGRLAQGERARLRRDLQDLLTRQLGDPIRSWIASFKASSGNSCA